ncbi:hypothetical protein C7974DRAFT_375371 [Boeremia exigua]|uniref:uncharacterized protein n=1 Tax=Boeremia exigua TaxID=749465 RepID=UPI001E8D2030|nr:uncharacterized protein C7974DRAFT_375371 [Boeremia exigua]KAH6633267.1 hypothetical protein C7974DRAFT_375371 [Boeremia exigua]
MSAPNANKPNEGIAGQIGISNATNYVSETIQGSSAEASGASPHSTEDAKAAAKRAKMKAKNNRNRNKRRENEKLERKNAKKQARLSPAQNDEDSAPEAEASNDAATLTPDLPPPTPDLPPPTPDLPPPTPNLPRPTCCSREQHFVHLLTNRRDDWERKVREWQSRGLKDPEYGCIWFDLLHPPRKAAPKMFFTFVCPNSRLKVSEVTALTRAVAALKLQPAEFRKVADTSYKSSHVHNLSNDSIAIDINEEHIFFETDFENGSVRKRHQSGAVPCDHPIAVQCKFGLVHYADKQRPATSIALPEGKEIWLKQRLDKLRAAAAADSQLSNTADPSIPHAPVADQVSNAGTDATEEVITVEMRSNAQPEAHPDAVAFAAPSSEQPRRRLPPGNMRTRCDACCKSKKGCIIPISITGDRGPCERCVERGITCEYPPSVTAGNA